MLLSVWGPGMAVGALAVWVTASPRQLRAGMCPRSGDRRDLPRSLALPRTGGTVLCIRAMRSLGTAGGASQAGGITVLFPARTACP